MAFVTIQVLEGLERGRLFAKLSTPIAIGREDENEIQLNDDRVSRFHAKMQEDAGKVILTDLESTNGTRVNGHPIRMRVLQSGDIISVGRCVLLYSEAQPAVPQKLHEQFERSTSQSDRILPGEDPDDGDVDFIAPPPGVEDESGELFPAGPPEIPGELRPLQRAQLSDLLAYFHERLGGVIAGGMEEIDASQTKSFRCDHESWKKMVRLQADLCVYLSQIAEPESPAS